MREQCGPELAETLGFGLSTTTEELPARVSSLTALAPAVLRAMKGQVLCSRQLGDAAREQREAQYFADVWAGEAHAAALAKLKL